ncbi:MAG: sugar-transfer associated ATP-grasp domain-containing protein [Emergencia sp.]|nr:sugar-transfer associated ATP-grasp domain-containing protein [Emergencia sp.]
MGFFGKALQKIKLFVLYWRRIVFVKNNFKVNIFTKLRANIFGGFLGDQYVLYDFKHNDKKKYLSEFDWYRSRYINEPFDFAFNNKVVCADILSHYIKVAENLFIKNKGILYDFSTGMKQNEDIHQCLLQKGKLMIKPYAMGKGKGVHLLRAEKESLYIDSKPVSKEELFQFLDKKQDFIICEYIRQHKYADDIYDKTTNTIRLITLREPDTHKNKVFFAVQRMGTSGTIPVDNGSKGGLVSKIDIETGRLTEAKCLHSLDTYETHPDSGTVLRGIEIPNWQAIKVQILEVADKLPYMDFIAWDLLITEDGTVCVIEANTSSGVNIIQLWGGQRQEELGDFFRYYHVIK